MKFKIKKKLSCLLIVSMLLSNVSSVYGTEISTSSGGRIGNLHEGVEQTTSSQMTLTTGAHLYLTTPSSIYLENPGFDEELDGWENPSWATGSDFLFTLDETNGINGGACAKLTGNVAIEQDLKNAQPYTSYRLSVYAKGSGQLEIGSGNDKHLVDLSDEYQETSMVFKSDVNGKPRIYAYTSQGAEAYVDNFNVELMPVATIDGGTVSIKAEDQLQTFDGWGTSLVWFANVIGGWAEENRTAISDLLFDQEEGLGFNIVRYNIGGGDAPGHDHMRSGGEMEGFATGFDGDALEYDWTADANQVQVLKDAIARGVDITEAFSNTPPYFMTESGCASGSNGEWANNLKNEHYDDFADYLTEVVKYFKEEHNIVFDYLAPLNEPYTNYWKEYGGQEGCHFDVDKQEQIIQLTKEYLQDKDLTGTEVAAMDESILDTGLKNFKSFSQETKDAMDKWNIHTYGGGKRKESKNAAAMHSKDLWMSEVDLGGRGKHNPDSILPAIDLARRITTDMKEIQPTAWCIWQAVENWPNMMPIGENSNWGLILANFEGEGAGGLEEEAYRTTKKYYGMKQYSKFIRPGAVMLQIDDNNTLGFYNKEDNQLVFTYVNDSDYSNKQVDFDLEGFNSVGSTVSVYRTSGELDCEQGELIPVIDNILTDVAPKQSITTYVIEGVVYDDSIIKLNESTITDENEVNRFEYTGDWKYDGWSGEYVGDNIWAYNEGDTATLYFSGDRAQIYGVKDRGHGMAKVYVDDYPAVEINLYNSYREEGVCIFDTNMLDVSLANGPHTIRIEATGEKHNLASGTAIAIDYAKIFNNGKEETPTNTSFKPGDKWYDTKGERIQAHGGGMWYDEEAQKYYWYGEDKTYGYRPLRGVRCYSSTDLYNWTDEGLALEAMASMEDVENSELYEDRTDKTDIFRDLDINTAVMERPKVIYNEKTDKWVMWFHADGPTETSDANYAKAKAGVAISDSPTGPFTYIRSYRLDQDPDPSRDNQGMARDMTLFVDDDGTGYIIYSSEENATMYISKLTEDYLDVVGWHKDNLTDEKGNPIRDTTYKGVEGEDYIRIFDGWSREAPALFKYEDMYYLITSGCTGWAPNQAKYAMADNIFGPWEEIGDPCIDDTNKTTFYSQSTYVLPVDAQKGKFIFMADRWNEQQLGDSRYIWLPIKFESDGTIGISWEDEWDLGLLDTMGKVEIISELPTVATYGVEPELPTTVTIRQGDSKKEMAVTWELASDLFNKVGEVRVSGELEDGHKITISLFVVPENVLYFVNSGDSTSKEYLAMKEAMSDTLINKEINDQAYSEGKTWGYSGLTGEEKQSSGIYESLRYVTKGASERNIEYTFTDLAPGQYTVYLGVYDPWAQWANGKRKANIFVNDQLKENSVSIDGTERTCKYADITVDKDLKVTLKPVNTGANTDIQISWLMIAKQPEAVINAPQISITPDTTVAEKVRVTITPADTDGGTRLEYKLGVEGTWTTYTEAFELTNNTTVYARALDHEGRVSEVVSRKVTNIGEPPYEDPSNLCPNGSFEEGVWTVDDKHILTTNPEEVHSGSQALKLVGSTSLGRVITDLMPDTYYMLEGYFKGDEIWLGVKNYGEGGNKEIRKKIVATNYEKQQVLFKTGDNSTSADIYALREASSGYTLVDDIKLTKVDDIKNYALNNPNISVMPADEIQWNHPIENAVDGDMNTRWCNAGDATVQIDLKQQAELIGVELRLENGDLDFAIHTSSDGSEWAKQSDTRLSNTNENYNAQELFPENVYARYVKVEFFGDWSGCYELRVLGIDKNMPSYAITMDTSIRGGKILTSKNTAKAGEIIDVTVLPYSGKQLVENSLKYISEAGEKAIHGASFEMPEEDVMITAAFEDIGIDGGIVIPYESALDQSAVTQKDLSDIREKGYFIGNGEINAIVYSENSDLYLRVAKNDFWDNRIDTTGDVMPTVDVAAQSFTTGISNAWENTYPTGINCGAIKLAGMSEQTEWGSAKLDLKKALVTVESDVDTSNIRALARENVFYIDSNRPVTLEGISGQSYLPDPTIGTERGYSYLHQVSPGDADVPDTHVYMVLGSKGTRHAIAVVSSRESEDPLNTAIALVEEVFNQTGEDVVLSHESVWREYWSKSGVQLEDEEFQRWWYRMLYYFRSFARSNGNAVGLKAGFETLAGWHNSLKLNYNTQQTYFSAGPINHPELMEPLIDTLNRNLKRAKWFAKTNFIGSEGAFFHSDIWPFEPDPDESTTNNKHQFAYMPWGYTWGMQGHIAFNLWEYYQYKPTQESLDRIYPLLKEFALFYCSVLEMCQLDGNGKRLIGPSYFPENGNYGQYNVSYDIAFINYALEVAREAALINDSDADLVARIDILLEQMPTYSTVSDPGQGNQTVIEQWLGAGLQKDDRHASTTLSIFPAADITYFSNQEDKDLFIRTINRAERITTHANSNVMLNISRARLSLTDEAISNTKACFNSYNGYSRELPNGFFHVKDHGYYISEQVAISRLITEFLLQSVENIIRVFPAWPTNKDAHFKGLLAQGGFEVSSDLVNGVIPQVTIKSTVGGNVRLYNPWENSLAKVVEAQSGAEVIYTMDKDILTFATEEGKTYIIEEVARVAPNNVTFNTDSLKKVYEYDEELNLSGLKVTAYYDNDIQVVLSERDYTVSGYDKTVEGIQKVTVTFGEYTFKFDVEVLQKPILVLNNDSEVIKSSDWHKYNDAALYSGVELYSKTEGSTISYTFDGTGIEIIGNKNPGVGSMRVYIDDEVVAPEVVLYQNVEPGLKKQILYKVVGLEPGTHTIKIEVIQQATGGARNTKVSFDAFKVYRDSTSKYTITVDNTNGGSITVDKVEAKAGETVAVTVSPDEGYQMVEDSLKYKVGLEETTITGSNFVMPVGDVVVTAAFEKDDTTEPEEPEIYRITVANTKGGSITVDKVGAKAGETVAVTVSPDKGYQMVEGSLKYKVGVEETTITGSSFVMPVGDVVVTAAFEKDDTTEPEEPEIYRITVANTKGGSITVDKVGAKAGETVVVTVSPDEGYQMVEGSLKYKVGVEETTITGSSFIMPAGDVVVTASFKVKPTTDPDTDSGNDSTTTEQADSQHIGSKNKVHENVIMLDYKVAKGEGGSGQKQVVGQVSREDLEKALEYAKKNGGNGSIILDITTTEDIKQVQLMVPQEALTGIIEEGLRSIIIKTDVGKLSIPTDLLTLEEVTDKQPITFRIEEKDVEGAGIRSLIEMGVYINDTPLEWEDENKLVTVEIPYTPSAEDIDVEYLTVYELKGEKVLPIRAYFKDDTMRFNVSHFGQYAIAYSDEKFNDLSDVEWARKPVTVLANKGIINGTSLATYSPHNSITRADFIMMLVRTLNLKKVPQDNFNDVNEDVYYYEAVGIAKSLGITNGVGDNKFLPESYITREEMMVMVDKALEVSKCKVTEETDRMIKFIDYNEVSDYAVKSVEKLLNSRIINGSNNSRIVPKANCTRAEIAVVIYNIYHLLEE